MNYNFTIKKYSIESIVAFILGFSSSLYVAYIGLLGVTIIRLDFAFSIIIFFFLLFKKNAFKNLSLYFNKSIALFLVVILISGVNALYYSTYIGYVDRFGKSLIIFIISILTYACVLLLKDHKKVIIKGMLLGLILNIAISIIQYISFHSGNYFTLYNVFPQPSFYIPVFNFRTQGLFLEPSHMVQYITSTILLFFLFYKKGIWKKIYTIALIIIMALSKSGNVMIILFMVAIFYMGKRKEVRKGIKPTSIIMFSFLSVIITINLNMIVDYFNVLDFDTLINTIFFRDRSGSDRLTGMLSAFELIKEYPHGVGYGMSKTLFDYYGNAITSFNYLLTVQLEMGIIGTVAYMFRLYSLGLKAILVRASNYQLALGLSIIASEFTAILNGGYFGSALWLLYGLASISLHEEKLIATLNPKHENI